MTGDPVAVAQSSFGRCREAPDFFPTFYAELLVRCPAARPMFAKTDFDRQNKLLDHAIGLLLDFSRQPGSPPNILSRVAGRHSRADLNVSPELYPFFVDSLVAAVRKFDPKFDADTEAAWRTATGDGVAYMASKY